MRIARHTQRLARHKHDTATTTSNLRRPSTQTSLPITIKITTIWSETRKAGERLNSATVSSRKRANKYWRSTITPQVQVRFAFHGFRTPTARPGKNALCDEIHALAIATHTKHAHHTSTRPSHNFPRRLIGFRFSVETIQLFIFGIKRVATIRRRRPILRFTTRHKNRTSILGNTALPIHDRALRLNRIHTQIKIGRPCTTFKARPIHTIPIRRNRATKGGWVTLRLTERRAAKRSARHHLPFRRHINQTQMASDGIIQIVLIFFFSDFALYIVLEFRFKYTGTAKQSVVNLERGGIETRRPTCEHKLRGIIAPRLVDLPVSAEFSFAACWPGR